MKSHIFTRPDNNNSRPLDTISDSTSEQHGSSNFLDRLFGTGENTETTTTATNDTETQYPSTWASSLFNRVVEIGGWFIPDEGGMDRPYSLNDNTSDLGNGFFPRVNPYKN